MNDQNLYETIEAYLNGNLEGKLLSDFEARLRTDMELAKQVSMFKDIDYVISDKPVLDFQKLVTDQGSAFLQEKKVKKTKVKIINWRRNLIAAAFLLLLAVAVFLIKNQLSTPLSGPDLFAQHFESYNLNRSLRSSDITSDSFDLAIQKYRSENFREASEIFQNLSDASPSDMITTFCLANSYINQKPSNFSKAKAEYERIIQNGNSIYVPASKWYLALISIAQEDRSSAEKLLNELKNEGGNWGLKANNLIDELE